MGLQEHAGDKEEADDQLDVQPDQAEAKDANEEDAEADLDAANDKDDDAEQAKQSPIAQAFNKLVADKSGQPEPQDFVDLAVAMGATVGSAEFEELRGLVENQFGNDYAAKLDDGMAKSGGDEAKDDGDQEEGAEADAADEEVAPEAEQSEEEAPADSADAEQEGADAAAVPEAVKDDPAVQEEVEAQAEEKQEETPDADEVKDENAEEADAAAGDEAQEEEAATEVAAPDQDLQRGDKSAEVEELQLILVNLGLMSQEEMDTGPGIFGPRTELALRAFQESSGLPATGFYGPQTRAAIASLTSEPPPMEKLVRTAVQKAGSPQPDFGIMVALYGSVDAAEQDAFMLAVANVCTEEYAAALQTEIDTAMAAPAEEAKEESVEEPGDEGVAPAPAPEEAPADAAKEESEEEAPAEQQAVASDIDPAAQEQVKEAVVEEVPEAAPPQQAEEAAKPEADASKVEEKEPDVEEANADAQEEAAEKDDAEAAPTDTPEVKAEAAAEEKAELQEEPEEAKLSDEEKPEESEGEQEAKKETVEQQAEAEVDEKPDDAKSVEALKSLLDEADRLLGMAATILQDPLLETSQEGIKEDAEAMLARWDADLDNYTGQLEQLAEKLGGNDLGQGSGTDDMVAAAADKAQQLRDSAAQMKGGAPAKVSVKVALESGEAMSFAVPVSSRDGAVGEILQAFLAQLELHDREKAAEAQAEPEAADEPPPAA